MKFEDTFVKAKEVVDATGQKAKEFVNVQKVKMQIVKVRSEIENDYKLLGKLYYQGIKCENVDGEALNAIVEQIDLESEKLRELRAELAFAKGDTVCDKCGAVNFGDAEFCSQCGETIN